jgi:Zn-dependent peptidase ImmA (M78 family)
MPLELTTFADKLRRYRAQFEASIDEVSESTGIPAEVLSAFESAQRKPTGDEVLILADYYKCDFRFFISNEQLAPFEQTEKLFRKLGDKLTPADRWAIQEFLFLCESEAFLARSRGGAIPRAFAFAKKGTFLKRQGEEAALRLRRHLGYEPYQIPVDVFDDFRAIGIHVFRRQLENSSISGLYLKHPTAGKCVLVNYSEDVYRQRFTAAHEAAHSILDEEEDFVVSASWDHSSLVEARANTFAGHFLVPPEYVQRMPATVWDDTSIVATANRLRVNVDVLVIALQRENLIDNDAVLRFKGLRIPRTDKIDPELPSSLSATGRALKIELLRRGLSNHYARLCFDAYERGLISASRLAELMLTDEKGLAEIGSAYGWSPKHGA